jgi:hypothetical protein
MSIHEKAAPILAVCGLIAVLHGAPAVARQTEPKPPSAIPVPEDLYPARRQTSAVHLFSVADDLKADVVRKSLADLSTKSADCRIVYGPVHSSARPNKSFLAVEAPASVDAKDLFKALKKGAPSAEVLAWTSFQSEDKTLGAGMGGGMPGFSPRDFVLGTSNDLRWVEAQGGFVEFFFTPGKLTAETLADRFHKLAQPFGVKDVGKVVQESFTWPLAEPLDEAAAKRAEKALAKIDGVRDAKIDVTAKTLHVTVALENLKVSGPATALPGIGLPKDAADANASAPRLRFAANAVIDALEHEHLALGAEASNDKGPKKGG